MADDEYQGPDLLPKATPIVNAVAKLHGKIPLSGAVKGDVIRNEIRKVQAALRTLSEAIALGGDAGDTGASRTNIQSFMDGVANSMIEAQNKLDKASMEYLQSGNASPVAHPAVFRIPRLRAELRFAMEAVDEEKVNVIFYQAGSQKTESHQQVIEFDLTAVPPPLETVTQVKKSLPRVSHVLGRSLREELRGMVETQGGEEFEPWKDLLIQNWKNVVVLTMGSPDDCLLFYVSGDAKEVDVDKDLGVWIVHLPTREVKVLYRHGYKPRVKDDIRPLRALILRIAEKQHFLVEES